MRDYKVCCWYLLLFPDKVQSVKKAIGLKLAKGQDFSKKGDN
jgi:hypothetical protein